MTTGGVGGIGGPQQPYSPQDNLKQQLENDINAYLSEPTSANWKLLTTDLAQLTKDGKITLQTEEEFKSTVKEMKNLNVSIAGLKAEIQLYKDDPYEVSKLEAQLAKAQQELEGQSFGLNILLNKIP